MAIIPGAGGTQRLSRIIGVAKAKELIYTSKVVDGVEAEKIGLVNMAVPQNEQKDAAYKKALELANQIVANVTIKNIHKYNYQFMNYFFETFSGTYRYSNGKKSDRQRHTSKKTIYTIQITRFKLQFCL